MTAKSRAQSCLPPGKTAEEWRRKVERARGAWRPGELVSDVRPWIQHVWTELSRRGVPERTTTVERLGPEGLRQRQRLRHMDIVLDAVRNKLTHEVAGMVAVADPDCWVLLAAGDRDACRAAADAGLTLGVRWSLSLAGTNGIGLGAILRRSCQIFADEHWKYEQRNLVCTVRPIFSDKELVAIINVTDHWKTAHSDKLVLLDTFGELVELELQRLSRR